MSPAAQPQPAGAAPPEYSAQPTQQVDNAWQAPRDNGEEITYHTWPAERYPPIDNSQQPIDSTLRNATIPPPPQANPTWTPAPVDHYPSARYSTYNPPQPTPGTQAPQPQPLDTTIYASASYAQQQQEQQAQAQYQGKPYTQESTPPSTIPPLPRHTYTRTLVGPLAANACRLLDEHRKPGIFFLFQDLSIRTEGMFGSPPASAPVHPSFPVFASMRQSGSRPCMLRSSLSAALRTELTCSGFPFGPLYTGTFRLRLRLMNVGA